VVSAWRLSLVLCISRTRSHRCFSTQAAIAGHRERPSDTSPPGPVLGPPCDHYRNANAGPTATVTPITAVTATTPSASTKSDPPPARPSPPPARPSPTTLTYSPTMPAAVRKTSAHPSRTSAANMPANQGLGTAAISTKPSLELDEGETRLISKRKLDELVKQIDPEEKLDPEVEEVSPHPQFCPFLPLRQILMAISTVGLGVCGRVHR
jgi:transcription initiation factor TFIID subunit 12